MCPSIENLSRGFKIDRRWAALLWREEARAEARDHFTRRAPLLDARWMADRRSADTLVGVEASGKHCSQSSRVRFGRLAVFDRREIHGSLVVAVARHGCATS